MFRMRTAALVAAFVVLGLAFLPGCASDGKPRLGHAETNAFIDQMQAHRARLDSDMAEIQNIIATGNAEDKEAGLAAAQTIRNQIAHADQILEQARGSVAEDGTVNPSGIVALAAALGIPSTALGPIGIGAGLFGIIVQEVRKRRSEKHNAAVVAQLQNAAAGIVNSIEAARQSSPEFDSAFKSVKPVVASVQNDATKQIVKKAKAGVVG